MQIPFVDLRAQMRSLKNEILPVWEEILDSAWFIGGEYVKLLEDEFAEACTTKYCVSTNSGTDSLRFIFLALGLHEGDEVITVPNTFIATTEAITQAGAKIVFVDIDPLTYNMDPLKIPDVITEKTRGIVPVHLFGQTAEMDPILDIARKHDLWVVEDACQAHLAEYKGRKAGSMGIAGAFSFYPGKNMGACGDGGAVVTDDEDIALKIRKLRDHGQSTKYYHDTEGYNGRCDAIQAAALRIKLKYLAEWNRKRRKNAEIYNTLLSESEGITIPSVATDCLHVYHLYVVQVEQPGLVAKKLKAKGIDTGFHYPVPLHLQKAYEAMNLGFGSFPNTEAFAKKLLSLPMFPELTEEQIGYVCHHMKELVSELN